MVYDVITYNGEKELFNLRYNILKDFVDEFIVVEFDKTFSGKSKEWLFNTKMDKVSVYCKSEAEYMQYKDLALSSPNTQYGKGAEHWIREFCQKESIKDCLIHLKDDDIVFIGDCDEIWNPALLSLKRVFPTPLKLKLKVYTYWLNNRSTEEFWGTIESEYGYIKNGCLNHIRSNAEKANGIGWHFTSMAKSLKQKLKDSYTEEDYATDEILEELDENIENDRDFLGRDFTYKIDESKWPQYLKDNKDKYRHLMK